MGIEENSFSSDFFAMIIVMNDKLITYTTYMAILAFMICITRDRGKTKSNDH